jgi:hypothetical protein
MGTRQDSTTAQAVNKKPKCSICREYIKPACDWYQGRCPHTPAMIDTKVVKTQFQKLLKLFRGKAK